MVNDWASANYKGGFEFEGKQVEFSVKVYGLVYINNFYNYATIFFMLIAIGANSKIKKVAPWIYFVNVVISYTLKRLGIVPFFIHSVYCVMFHTKINYVFAIHKPEKAEYLADERREKEIKEND